MCRLLAIYGTYNQWQPAVSAFCHQVEKRSTVGIDAQPGDDSNQR